MNDKFNLRHSVLIQQDDKFQLLNNRRLLYPDILRTLAVFAVMMIHVCSYGFFNYDVSSFEWWILNFYNGLLRWAVPIFVMVSGMFFLNPEKEVPIRKLYRKNIFRIVVALGFWGFLYQSTNVVKRIFWENTNSSIAILDALKEFILGPAWFHLWFLYMIIGLYMFVPLFRIFTRNAKEEHFRYLFIMFIVWGSTYPFLQDLILCFDNSLKLHFCLKEFVGYFCYFVLGYYLSVRVFFEKNKDYCICDGGGVCFISNCWNCNNWCCMWNEYQYFAFVFFA